MSRQSAGPTGIKSLGYDPITKALLITCESGDAYRYTGIGKEVYDSLLAAASREQFVRESIEGKYPRKKISLHGGRRGRLTRSPQSSLPGIARKAARCG